jgi:arginyl-tRNA synthetase
VADPQHVLAERLAAAVVRAFGGEAPNTDTLVRPAQNSRFGDYQSPVAMGLSKTHKRPGPEIARAILDRVDLSDLCDAPEIAGPGFINLRLRDDRLAAAVGVAREHPRLDVRPAPAAGPVVVDYSGPNVAKAMHVGHLRSTVIGDALARTLAFLGQDVVRQNHLGDWGTQFGMLIEHLLETGADAGDPTVVYREAAARFKDDAAFADLARGRVVALHAGDAAVRAVWQRLVDQSIAQFASVYRRLDVTLTADDIRPESFYNPLLADVVSELTAKGLTQVSEGALCVFLPGFTRPGGDPLPMIIRKSDGGYLYATTDLAALRYRVQVLGARRLVYVTDARQQQHFRMVFETAKLAGWVGPDVSIEHVPFGMVLGDDGKPFKTRSGENVALEDLIDEAERRAAAVVAEKNPSLNDATRAGVAHAVGVGAIKYADLSSDRAKNYVFDWDSMLAMEGNTGPYLQYAYVRIRSIFRKAGLTDVPAGATVALTHPAERRLALALLQFDSAVHAVARTLEPHRLCTYLFELATAFSGFYETCPVLSAGDARDSRLVLCDATARTLRQALSLLGIIVLDAM